MIKVVCIDNSNLIREPWTDSSDSSDDELEIGKTYNVIRGDDTSYLIDGHGWYYMKRFLTLEEWRDKKLKQLDI
jgi:hypothetical protein